MKRMHTLSLVGLSLALSTQARAAFTLEQVYDLAVKKSETITLGQLEIERQQQSGAVIKTRNRPRVNLAGSFDRTWTRIDRTDRNRWEPAAQAEVRQPLYEGGTISAQLQSVEYATNAARWDLEASKENLYLDIAQLFYQIVGAEQDMSNLRESEKIYRDRVDTLQGRAKIGKSRNAEVLAARTQLEAINAQIKASSAARDVAQRRLAWLTGQNAPMSLIDRLNIQNATLAGNAQKLLPTVEAARARVALADSKIEEARSVSRPHVDLIGSYNWQHPFPDDVQTNKLAFGVGLTWTLYDAGEVNATVATAAIEKKQASVTEALETRENRLARDQAEQAFRDGLEQIRLYDKALDAAERNVKIQQQEFENGLLTNLEVMQALDTRLSIKRNRDQALYNAKLDYIEAQLQLKGLPKTMSP